MDSPGSTNQFTAVTRQSFRRAFQPSRIVIAVVPDPERARVNLITLCFNMYCSYKPPMMSFAVFQGSHTFSLLARATECVLAVPGERLATQALLCGVESGRERDKARDCGFTLVDSQRVGVPSIRECIANIELRLTDKVRTGDHMTVFGEVLRFGLDERNCERCLVSVGPDHLGYTLLAQKGIHRIAVVDNRGPSSDQIQSVHQ
jgi:flavin reductase (DIM6/NTAB) family NADH-FMN oxidoreductase RutF